MRSSKFISDAPASIMLTPLVDMFTTIVIFLLYQFASHDGEAWSSASIELPRSTFSVEERLNQRIELSSQGIQVNSIQIEGYNWKRFSEALLAAKFSTLEPLAIRADKTLKSGDLDDLLFHLSQHGFSRIHLIVIREHEEAL